MAKVNYYYVWITTKGATITWQPSVLETYSDIDRWHVWFKSPKKKSAKVV